MLENVESGGGLKTKDHRPDHGGDQNILLNLMATMARLHQEKRVERIKQRLENKLAVLNGS